MNYLSYTGRNELLAIGIHSSAAKTTHKEINSLSLRFLFYFTASSGVIMPSLGAGPHQQKVNKTYL